ncbi:hypothetical protein imdm_770 [gamma proteobacterium IMCC2047]|nr:hypothetical protein imdm_770 [gamma proteobacterium IMCC2047]
MGKRFTLFRSLLKVCRRANGDEVCDAISIAENGDLVTFQID